MTDPEGKESGNLLLNKKDCLKLLWELLQPPEAQMKYIWFDKHHGTPPWNHLQSQFFSGLKSLRIIAT